MGGLLAVRKQCWSSSKNLHRRPLDRVGQFQPFHPLAPRSRVRPVALSGETLLHVGLSDNMTIRLTVWFFLPILTWLTAYVFQIVG